MSSSEGVVLRLCHFAEAREAAELTEGPHAVAAAGEDLVGVALVSDVPNYLVLGGVEHVVEGDSHFNDSEGGTEVPSGLGDCERGGEGGGGGRRGGGGSEWKELGV